MSDLPLYELVIKEDESDPTGVDFIALVGTPAIKRNWVAFNEEEIKTRFAFKGDDEKRIISGPAMIPDMPIYRRNDKGEEWEVMFKKPTIQRIIEKFFKAQNTGNFNLEHKRNLLADGVYLIESFMIDSERGINAPEGFKDLPDGTWFISCKVDNETIWNDFIKSGRFNGFSVEGYFAEKPVEEQVNEVEDFISKLKQLKSNIFTDMSSIKELVNKLKQAFEEMPETTEEKMSEAKLADGITVIRWDGEELAEGVSVNVVTEEGIIPAPDGKHQLQDGREIETKDGKILSVQGVAEQETEEKEIEVEMKSEIDFSSEIESMKQEMADCRSWIEALEIKIAKDGEMMSSQQTKLAHQSKVIEGLFEIVEKLSDEPSAEPIKTEVFNENFAKQREKTFSRVEEIAEHLKSLNTK